MRPIVINFILICFTVATVESMPPYAGNCWSIGAKLTSLTRQLTLLRNKVKEISTDPKLDDAKRKASLSPLRYKVSGAERYLAAEIKKFQDDNCSPTNDNIGKAKKVLYELECPKLIDNMESNKKELEAVKNFQRNLRSYSKYADKNYVEYVNRLISSLEEKLIEDPRNFVKYGCDNINVDVCGNLHKNLYDDIMSAEYSGTLLRGTASGRYFDQPFTIKQMEKLKKQVDEKYDVVNKEIEAFKKYKCDNMEGLRLYYSVTNYEYSSDKTGKCIMLNGLVSGLTSKLSKVEGDDKAKVQAELDNVNTLKESC